MRFVLALGAQQGIALRHISFDNIAVSPVPRNNPPGSMLHLSTMRDTKNQAPTAVGLCTDASFCSCRSLSSHDVVGAYLDTRITCSYNYDQSQLNANPKNRNWCNAVVALTSFASFALRADPMFVNYAMRTIVMLAVSTLLHGILNLHSIAQLKKYLETLSEL